ncbi:sigma factor G inhibitor Gin [Salinibacillus xinjiangensis]|uniref:Sigma-G inhibitor, Gin n=1 Tax=Salinibacillus xinjiangensis TaxID=1229268 RepID=A0A6G1XAW3_9BACI|nr:sigma factor G inhibitor Gin [Salinibacillus xinjiangensis]MRG88151.1 sigma-G inhibitor, Gin [Salinibacillus xinjiangensis]
MSKQTAVKKVCQVCNQEKAEGITVYTTFICLECEQEMINTEPGDEKYQYFVEKLRVINHSNQFS